MFLCGSLTFSANAESNQNLDSQIFDYEWAALNRIDQWSIDIEACGQNQDCKIELLDKIIHSYKQLVISRISRRPKESASAMFRQFDSTRYLFVKWERRCLQKILFIELRDNECHLKTLNEVVLELEKMFETELRFSSELQQQN